MGQSQTKSARSDLPRQPGEIRHQSRTEDGIDPGPAPGEGHADVLLPVEDGLLQAAQLLGQGSLCQTQIHRPATDLLAERPRLVRVTQWELTQSSSFEPQADKRQRNGVGSATRPPRSGPETKAGGGARSIARSGGVCRFCAGLSVPTWPSVAISVRGGTGARLPLVPRSDATSVGRQWLRERSRGGARSDLQSAPFGRSGTPPRRRPRPEARVEQPLGR